MSQTELQQLKLDPGGFIFPNTPENHALDAQLQATPALAAADLLKIARFLRGTEANAALATYLASAALQRLTQTLLLQQTLITKGDTVIDGAPLQDALKQANDFFTWNPQGPDPRAGIRWIPITTPITGLGLLVETEVATSSPDNPSSHVIGLCPAPTSLPD